MCSGKTLYNKCIRTCIWSCIGNCQMMYVCGRLISSGQDMCLFLEIHFCVNIPVVKLFSNWILDYALKLTLFSLYTVVCDMKFSFLYCYGLESVKIWKQNWYLFEVCCTFFNLYMKHSLFYRCKILESFTNFTDSYFTRTKVNGHVFKHFSNIDQNHSL